MPYQRKKFSYNFLLSALDYSKEDGLFRWKKLYFGCHHNVGDVAGSVDSHKGGYRIITILKKRYLAHRLAWLYCYGEWPDGGVDHINRVRDDNRICNLRLANKSQQAHHSGRANKYGHKGVSYSYTRERFTAKIMANGKIHYLGKNFPTAEAAAKAYEEAAITLFGEFACASTIPNPSSPVTELPISSPLA